MRKLWDRIKRWFRKLFGCGKKKPSPLKTFTVEIEDE